MSMQDTAEQKPLYVEVDSPNEDKLLTGSPELSLGITEEGLARSRYKRRGFLRRFTSKRVLFRVIVVVLCVGVVIFLLRLVPAKSDAKKKTQSVVNDNESFNNLLVQDVPDGTDGTLFKKPLFVSLKLDNIPENNGQKDEIIEGNSMEVVQDQPGSFSAYRKARIDSKDAMGKTGAVATDRKECSDIGLQVLKDGGNAVDAAIASGICIGLFNSHSSGIGGGGFMLIRKSTGETEVVDFRELAPKLANETMYANDIKKAQIGGLSVGVPGELKGYELAHKKYGKLKWQRLFEPTVVYGRDGYKMGPVVNMVLESNAEFLRNREGFKDIFFNTDGSVKDASETIFRKNYAATLEKVAKEGADAFYKGEIAQQMVDSIVKNGGIISLEDLSSYEPKIRSSLEITYKDKKMITSPPPTSGSVVASIFNMLELFESSDKPTVLELHRFIEILKFGFSDRTRLADPEFNNLEEIVKTQLSKEHAKQNKAKITDDRTHDFEYYEPEYADKEDHGTTHVAVVDKDGNAVSLTSTINLLFGSRVMDPKTGVIFNDNMDDFSTPGTKNGFGLHPSPKNFVKAGKRPLSTTSGTIVLDKNGKVEYVVGASGGSRILTAVAQVLRNCMEYGMTIKQAVDSPRIHHQLLPDELMVEPYYPVDLVNGLREKGHNIVEMAQVSSVVQAIRILSDGTIHAVSDGRKKGAPAAY
ncbi:Gamma-glutamyltranspeptidase 1 [Zancudomyces culisetae]|uniref:Glutathione hydrolase n=1 Tax=Zancudomyces culisetae TaxID=1213189 RepID=A0A1R1PQA1_ZANCU|nr:Gamma-glutamyltranspeptidase 1 [Zancudomyces culisetae]OMH83166.1 Gamma-glutamyltranspeptidase 1 [Zancudomyces culisetae]OMH85104.1 Gamma-glutamyltranspeptidase 1 [Zancudomyces culisetae]|eukprot:OMH79278.1 Gamma-glutamyltranspeptidase 1 [Zancudomyces culisetae]